MEPSISYTAVILDHNSHIKLRVRMAGLTTPFGWKEFCHHMTLNMGPLNEALNPELKVGSEVVLKATHFAFDQRVVAVKVESSANTTNRIPHITVAVDTENGAKPKHSNELPDWAWMPLDEEIELRGIVTEVENPQPATK